MKSFARHTKLTNICGRVDYITNEKKQEEIVCHSELLDFKEYAEFEKNNQKTAKMNNEGREVIISIPNEWYQLPKETFQERCQHLAECSCGKRTDMVWACHWNKDRTNLHVHVVFSERTRLADQQIKRYDRDIYLTEDGKIARRKADRAINHETGEILPPVHRKGEIKEGGFSTKNKIYKTRDWFEGTKERLQTEMEKMGVRFEEKGILHEYHEGKGRESEAIKEKNEVIRAVNKRVKELKEVLPEEQHKKIDDRVKTEIRNKNIIVPNFRIEEKYVKWNFVSYHDYSKAYNFIERTKAKFNEVIEYFREKMNKTFSHESHQKFDVNKHAEKMYEKLHGYMNARYKYAFVLEYNITELRETEISHEYRDKLEKLENHKAEYDDLSGKIKRKRDDLDKLGLFDRKEKKALKSEISHLEYKQRSCLEEMVELSKPDYYSSERDYMRVMTGSNNKTGYEITIDRVKDKAIIEENKEQAQKLLPQFELSVKYRDEFLNLAREVPDEYRESFQKAMSNYAKEFKKAIPEKNRKYGYRAWENTHSYVLDRMPLSSRQRQERERNLSKSKSRGFER